MLTAIVIAAFLSIQFASVHSGPIEKCIESKFHKKFPSPEPSGFATCFPWQNKSCCSPELTVELKTNGIKNLFNFDWDYCGGLSKPCKEYVLKENCHYFCDPNMAKWETRKEFIGGAPLCSDSCDKWFEACKNDKTYSENWLDDYVLYRSMHEPIIANRSCRTFAEIFKNGEGLCNHIWGLAEKYEKSSNCMVFDFKGENPNDKVEPVL